MSFFSESIKEFDHVVWPTKAETIKYFNIVVSMIVILTVFLFIVGTILSTGLFMAKEQIAPLKPAAPTTQTSTPASTDLKLDNLKVNSTATKNVTSPATTK